MTAEADAATSINSQSIMADSEDSDEETSQEELPVTSWNDLSIIERVGLNSMEMSEKDLETAFSQISLAFRCDQYTLKQRLQAEEHARNLAEENVHLELTRGRETLETLKGLCLDSKRSKILQRLQLSMDILGGTVERISNTAEVLGAVHQEARVSRAVELMVAHVENMRNQYDRNLAELEETKKLVQQQNPRRGSIDPGGSADLDSDNMQRSFHPNHLRRRVSVSLISSEIQEIRKRESKKRSGRRSSSSRKSCPSPSRSSESSFCGVNKEDGVLDDRPQDPNGNDYEGSSAQLPPDPAPVPSTECPPSNQVTAKRPPNKNPPTDLLRQRHKGKSVSSRKKPDKDKNANVHGRNSASTYGSSSKPPSTHPMNGCHWLIICFYLLVLSCVIMLTLLLWHFHDEAFDP